MLCDHTACCDLKGPMPPPPVMVPVHRKNGCHHLQIPTSGRLPLGVVTTELEVQFELASLLSSIFARRHIVCLFSRKSCSCTNSTCSPCCTLFTKMDLEFLELQEIEEVQQILPFISERRIRERVNDRHLQERYAAVAEIRIEELRQRIKREQEEYEERRRHAEEDLQIIRQQQNEKHALEIAILEKKLKKRSQ